MSEQLLAPIDPYYLLDNDPYELVVLAAGGDEDAQTLLAEMEQEAHFCHKFRDLTVVAYFETYDDESYGGSSVQPSHHDIRRVWEALAEYNTEIPDNADEAWIVREFCDATDAISVVSLAQHQADQTERERCKLESYVAKVARNAGIDAKATSEVLDALQALCDDAQSDLEGAREDGLCIGMGATVETWHDHCDGIRERGSQARDAMDWVAANAPLAWAAWVDKRQAEDDQS
jgi:hypothetical protein